MTINSEQIHALKALYANVEKQAHALRGNPREYSVITGLCPVNVIEMQAQKIQALLAESEADKALIAEQAKRIAELEASTVIVKLPTAYDLTGETDGNCSLNDASMKPDVGGCYFRRRDVEQSCAAAGITLVVEE